MSFCMLIMIARIISDVAIEFAKLLAFRAYVHYVPMHLTCLRASNYYVPTCLRALNQYLPTYPYFLRAYVPLFFTCLRAYVPIYIFQVCVPSCHSLFRSYVRSFFTCLRENISQNILRLTSILCIAVFLWIIILTLHSIKNPKTNSCF